MTQSEYAEHRGIVQQLVSRYCRDGRLRGAAVKTKRGRWQIDPEKADAALNELLDPAYAKPRPWKTGKAAASKWKIPGEEKKATICDAGLAGVGYHRARTENERYKAALNKIRWQTSTRDMVQRREVERAAFDVGRAVRDAVLNVPARVAAVAAGEADQFEVEKLLTKELKKALDELSSGKYHARHSSADEA
jgi:hypothetical protein